ncbi:putative Poly(Beta-D-mannuronate) C5 epimerase 2 [Magnetospirillum sp. XM-1]|uniref:FecR domain-containing protein n=1 Tax=Magnetospirillum sp. XM-1 TaxID=1663591 RepID=UPI00073DFFE4|nr:FecR domain-containing protein [Magnetospirillum sp. XM-1]CUW41222.1 putative Poly(Beta-D-mannuronate) C5 epimerase 2 [Magnetospirillum sp. XM-1]
MTASANGTIHDSAPTKVFDAARGGAITVPEGFALASADFHRIGPNLEIVATNGSRLVVRDFFALASPPDLHTGEGAIIPADLAVRLAGPMAPGQYAQSAPTQGPAPIGEVDATSGIAQVRHADGTVEAAIKGMAVFEGDVVTTGAKGSVGIVFVDGSTFSVGNAARAVLDQLSYDPGTNTGSSTVSVTNGPFSFISGEIARTAPDAMTVKTPVLTIGVRGTTVAGVAAPEGGSNTVALLADSGGTVGQIAIKNAAGVQVMSQVNQAVQMSSALLPPPPPIVLSPQQIQDSFGSAVQSLPPPQPPLQQRTEPPASPQMRQQQQQMQQKSDAASKTQAEKATAVAEAKAAVEAKVKAEAEKVAKDAAKLAADPKAVAEAKANEARLAAQANLPAATDLAKAATALFGAQGAGEIAKAATSLFGAQAGSDFAKASATLFGPTSEGSLAALGQGALGNEGFGAAVEQFAKAIDSLVGNALANDPNTALFGGLPILAPENQILLAQRIETVVQQQIQNQVNSVAQQASQQSTTVHTLTGGSQTVTTTSGVNDYITGTASANTVTISGVMGTGDSFIDETDGDGDKLILMGANTGFQVGKVETIDLSGTNGANTFIIGSDGTVAITLSSYADSITSSQLVGHATQMTTGSQTWNLTGLLGVNGAADAFDMGGGTDTMALLTAGTHSLTLTGVETLTLANGGNSLIFSTPVSNGMTVTGGSGTDSMTLALGGNSIVFGGMETIVGGSGSDALTTAGTFSGFNLDGGNGSDSLTWSTGTVPTAGSQIVISPTISNVESLIFNVHPGSGSGSFGSLETHLDPTDISGVTSLQITGGGAFYIDTTYLPSTVTSVQVAQSGSVSTLDGSGNPTTVNYADTDIHLRLSGATTSVTGGNGSSDSIVLSDGTAHTLSVSGVESITGGNGVDTVSATSGAVTFIGGAGADIVNFTASGGNADIMKYTATGDVGDYVNYFTAGEDKMSFDGALFSHTNGAANGTLGGFALNASDFTTTSAANSGKHFAYDTSTGNLYYDADANASTNDSVVVAHIASDSGSTAVSTLAASDIHFTS